MHKALAGNIKPAVVDDDDTWDTDADFENNLTKEQQRFGKERKESIDLQELRSEVNNEYMNLKKREYEAGPKASEGYGGKFGIQKDRMDKSAVGHDYKAEINKHASQTDAAKGFGGKYGVQTDRKDKSAEDWSYQPEAQKHNSQKDYATGFGGKYGVQKDRVDKSAVDYDYKPTLQVHQSQKDYNVGFGGKYGVQTDRMDKSAGSWGEQNKTEAHPSQVDHKKGFGGQFGVQTDRVDKSAESTWGEQTKTELHSSQLDHKKGFGGKFGVETDRVDKSAEGWGEQTKSELHPSQVDHKKGFGGKFGVETDRKDKSAAGYDDNTGVSSSYQKVKPEVKSSEGAKNLRSRFENLAKQNEEEAKKKAEEERLNRQAREKREKELAAQSEKKRLDDDRWQTGSGPETEDRNASEPRELNPPQKVLPVLPKMPPADDDEEEEEQTYNDIVSPPSAAAKSSAPMRPPPPSQGGSRKSEVEQVYNDVESTLPEESIYDDAGESEQPVYDDNRSFAHSARISAAPVEEDELNYEDVGSVSTGGSGRTAIALYDYEGAEEDELTFDPDEEIRNVEFIDDGWWKGECRGRVGLFPSNYVQLK